MRGYANAADWVYGRGIEPGAWSDGELISLAEIRHIHTLAVTPVWDVAPHPQATERQGPGSFREHELGAAEAFAITEKLAALHARFEQIHPFLDGNGRAVRLILNLLLVRLGLPPAIIYKGDRSR